MLRFLPPQPRFRPHCRTADDCVSVVCSASVSRRRNRDLFRSAKTHPLTIIALYSSARSFDDYLQDFNETDELMPTPHRGLHQLGNFFKPLYHKLPQCKALQKVALKHVLSKPYKLDPNDVAGLWKRLRLSETLQAVIGSLAHWRHSGSTVYMPDSATSPCEPIYGQRSRTVPTRQGNFAALFRARAQRTRKQGLLPSVKQHGPSPVVLREHGLTVSAE